jgi:predicted aldo/keto reductase-like oxidoreductase
VFGAGSRFCAVKEPDKSDELLQHALDQGLYYWDTAHIYVYDNVCSEERLGRVLKHQRDRVFLATKLSERSYDGAMRELESSLKRLQTDRLDILQVHSINSLEDVDQIGRAGSVLEVVRKAKDQKIARFIGFTGHASAAAMAAMVERFAFDTMLIALNHHTQGQEDFEHRAIPAAAGKGMGILLMKVIRPRETVPGLDPDDLIRYALSLEHGHAAVIGTDSMEVLKKNLRMARDFKPLDGEEMTHMDQRLAPFLAGHSLPWMQPGYVDGMPG